MIHQGHPYLYHGNKVVALETARQAESTYARVLVFDPSKPWLGDVIKVSTSLLVAMPLRYLHGQLPK